jgi:hypothetical protein
MKQTYEVILIRRKVAALTLLVSVEGASYEERRTAVREQALYVAHTIYWNFSDEFVEGYLNPSSAEQSEVEVVALKKSTYGEGLPPGCYDESGEVLFKDGEFPEELCRQRIYVVQNYVRKEERIGEGVNPDGGSIK